MNTKYTFLLPAFKGRFLDEMLRSIQGQTYRDFKVIISDDCSPEDLRSICEPYLADPRFTYRRNAENMGSKSLVSHWNLLVDMCDTEFLILASDDDVYEPQFLEEIDKLTVKYPKVDLFRGRAKIINNKSLITHKECKSNEYMESIQFIHRFYANDFIACVSNYCYRTNSLKFYGRFVDFPLAWFSDDSTNFMMSKKGCSITQKTTFCFRNYINQISSQWGNQKDSIEKVKATLAFYDWMKSFMQQYEESDTKDKVNGEWINKVHSNIINYIYHCPIFSFFLFLMRCPQDIWINKPRMVVHYLKNCTKK